MIKLVIFDLDGVLYDSKEYHFNALNDALAEVDEKYIISYKDHLAVFDGMPTNKKLEVLEKTKGLDSKHFKKRNLDEICYQCHRKCSCRYPIYG